jgi:hypothetical protein
MTEEQVLNICMTLTKIIPKPLHVNYVYSIHPKAGHGSAFGFDFMPVPTIR